MTTSPESTLPAALFVVKGIFEHGVFDFTVGFGLKVSQVSDGFGCGTGY